ncbi:hypothetical protein BJY01DRAFT_222729 [Aspergillus pseudoustus]|uniref:BZIP domain-containing protein n=1 Tax=Aspergillus pseudoustus TaxID=1810923 RepID=A0ABR4J7D3_9EURO
MPSSASGETLNARAKRVLGLDLDAWLAIESPDDLLPPPAPAGKRSEQIAQAQRKHRQRTQSYIQVLEQEVLRLRDVERDLTKEVQQLRNGAQPCARESLPVQNESLDEMSLNQTDQSAFAEPFEVPMADWQELYDSVAAEGPCCVKAAENTPLPTPWAPLQVQNINQSDMSLPTTGHIGSVEDSSSKVKDQVSLNPQFGINLILKLEAPCLPHLKNAVTSEPVNEGFLDMPYNFGTNHVYNLSTRIYLEYTAADDPSVTPKAQPTQITEADLQNLLQASERLQLANELTPVQVWALVCKLSSAHAIDPSVVSLMFEDLARYTYCNSFGTAVSKVTVRAALEYYLGSLS